MKTQLRVDWPLCKGRGLCHEVLPELIDLDEWGYPIVTGPVTRELLEERQGGGPGLPPARPAPDHLTPDASRFPPTRRNFPPTRRKFPTNACWPRPARGRHRPARRPGPGPPAPRPRSRRTAPGSRPAHGLAYPPLSSQPVQHARGQLGVELHGQVAAQHEGLRRGRVARDLRGPRRQLPAVGVPLEPRAAWHQLGIVGVQLDPAELGVRRGGDAAAVRQREQLAAEADAEHRDPGAVGLAQQVQLRPTQEPTSSSSYADQGAPIGTTRSNPVTSGKPRSRRGWRSCSSGTTWCSTTSTIRSSSRSPTGPGGETWSCWITSARTRPSWRSRGLTVRGISGWVHLVEPRRRPLSFGA